VALPDTAPDAVEMGGQVKGGNGLLAVGDEIGTEFGDPGLAKLEGGGIGVCLTGATVGSRVGCLMGAAVGRRVGCLTGAVVGRRVGGLIGTDVGCRVGATGGLGDTVGGISGFTIVTTEVGAVG
jgi:hypothetical protein